MMRSTVCTASGVWMVASTRCPVSAAVSAVEIVSRSRISPITTTSGSWRSTWRRASPKLWVSLVISRCFTMLRRLRWMNSMGSSTVMIIRCCSSLIWLMMAASVLVLPLPVGPVTNIRPLVLRAISSTTGGTPSWRSPRILSCTTRKAASTPPRWRWTFIRKRPMSATSTERSSSHFSSNWAFWASLRME